MFQFKQFSVDQSGCAMKINTDGVLLGAIVNAIEPRSILDIGTGTGVIALMLAQKFGAAKIDAVEIDTDAAQTATRNFKASPFANRLTVYETGFESYFAEHPQRKYDLLISNPPFYIDSLKSPGAKKTLAKHTDTAFFERLVNTLANQLSPNGCCWLVLPVNIAELVVTLAAECFIYPVNIVNVLSYPHSPPHRIILCLGFCEQLPKIGSFIIYKEKDVYADEYRELLRPYFLAF
jgi:tRNA1Val (adenine37-N6)-methyltransferase